MLLLSFFLSLSQTHSPRPTIYTYRFIPSFVLQVSWREIIVLRRFMYIHSVWNLDLINCSTYTSRLVFKDNLMLPVNQSESLQTLFTWLPLSSDVTLRAGGSNGGIMLRCCATGCRLYKHKASGKLFSFHLQLKR